MSKANQWLFAAPAWIAQRSSWLAPRAQSRPDAEAASRLEFGNPRDLGSPHTEAVRSVIALAECGEAGRGSWIHAAPRLPHRFTRRVPL